MIEELKDQLSLLAITRFGDAHLRRMLETRGWDRTTALLDILEQERRKQDELIGSFLEKEVSPPLSSLRSHQLPSHPLAVFT